jgi:deoxyhypusine monooxygenase
MQKPSVRDLQTILLNASLPLFQRCRVMFALRDLVSPPDLPTAIPAVEALERGFEVARERHKLQ